MESLMLIVAPLVYSFPLPAAMFIHADENQFGAVVAGLVVSQVAFYSNGLVAIAFQEMMFYGSATWQPEQAFPTCLPKYRTKTRRRSGALEDTRQTLLVAALAW